MYEHKGGDSLRVESHAKAEGEAFAINLSCFLGVKLVASVQSERTPGPSESEAELWRRVLNNCGVC